MFGVLRGSVSCFSLPPSLPHLANTLAHTLHRPPAPGNTQHTQIDGNHSMDAVFSAICANLEAAKSKIDDPLESFCADNPSDLECLVYDD